MIAPHFAPRPREGRVDGLALDEMGLLRPGAVVAVLAAVLLAIRHPGGDSLAALPQSAAAIGPTSHQTSRDAGRLIQQHSIQDPVLGEIGVVVSLPDPLPDRPLPVVVVLGGLGRGLETVEKLPPAGDNVVVGYDWPLPEKLPRGVDFLRQGPTLYERVLQVPGQIAGAIRWVAAQPWAEPERISILGFSLGALAAPSAQRVLEAQGQPVGWTVLAYGGADLGTLLAQHPRIRPDWLRPLVGWIADFYLGPLDPAEHLPHLSGRFLLVGGKDDGLVPEASAKLMRDLAPDPKTVVLLDGRHIGVGANQTALLDEILAVVETWLTDQGAVNPR